MPSAGEIWDGSRTASAASGPDHPDGHGALQSARLGAMAMQSPDLLAEGERHILHADWQLCACLSWACQAKSPPITSSPMH